MFNDHTPLPIFRITSCSEAMDVFFSADDRQEYLDQLSQESL